MSVYTYAGNKIAGDTTRAVIVRRDASGDPSLTLNVGDSADITPEELAVLSSRFVMNAGASNNAPARNSDFYVSNPTQLQQALDLVAGSAGIGRVRGTPGTVFNITAPIVIGSNTFLDMTGCTVRYASTSQRHNLITNAAAIPIATATDVTTTVGSSVITSPTLAAQAQVNQRLSVVGAGPNGGDGNRIHLYGVVQSIAGNNITLTGNMQRFGVAAGVALSNATGYLYKRDTNIEIKGGRWDAGTNWNVLAERQTQDSSQMRLHRVDGLVVRELTLAATGFPPGGGWMFGIAPGDATDVVIEDITGDGSSTCVQGEGPLDRVVVRNIRGTTQDDQVAFGTVGAGGITGQRTELEGDLTNIEVDGVHSENSWSNFKVFGLTGSNGALRPAWNIKASRLRGWTQNWAVQVIDYAGSLYCDNITLDDVTVTPGSISGNVRPQVYVNASGGHTITVNRAAWGADAPPAIAGVVATGVGCQNLRVRDLNISGSGTGYIGVLLGNGAFSFESVDIDGVTVPDTAVTADVVQLASSAVVVDRLSVRNVRQKGPGNVVNNSGRPVTEVVLSNIQQSNAGVSLYTSLASSNASIIHVDNYGNAVAMTTAILALRHPATVFLSNSSFNSSGPVARAFGATATPVRVYAAGIRQLGAGVVLSRDATQALSADGFQIATDVATLTPSDGDVVTNTNAGLGCGTGRVIYNAAATKWKHLYTGLTN